MTRGEIWGQWFPGAGPMLGVVVTTVSDGAQVKEVFADSPAAAADVQVGDFVRKVDGQAVKSLDDLYRVLAAKDPGQHVAVELTRGGQTLSKSIQLMPRVP